MSRHLCRRLGGQLLRQTPAAALRAYSTPAATTFDWQDPLSSKSLLTEDERAISETAERYCQEQLLPRLEGTFFCGFVIAVKGGAKFFSLSRAKKALPGLISPISLTSPLSLRVL